MNLFVAGVPYDFDDVDLKEMFELYGDVNSARVILDKETRKSKGFGFVDFANTVDAEKAIQDLDGVQLEGKTLAVKVAEDRKNNSEGGGGGFNPDKKRDGYNKPGYNRDRNRF